MFLNCATILYQMYALNFGNQMCQIHHGRSIISILSLQPLGFQNKHQTRDQNWRTFQFPDQNLYESQNVRAWHQNSWDFRFRLILDTYRQTQRSNITDQETHKVCLVARNSLGVAMGRMQAQRGQHLQRQASMFGWLVWLEPGPTELVFTYLFSCLDCMHRYRCMFEWLAQEWWAYQPMFFCFSPMLKAYMLLPTV